MAEDFILLKPEGVGRLSLCVGTIGLLVLQLGAFADFVETRIHYAGIYWSYQSAYIKFGYPCLGGPSMYIRLDGGHAMKSALWSTKWLAGRVDYVRTDGGPFVIAGNPSWYAAVSEAEVLGKHFDHIHRSRQALDGDTHLSMAFATSTVSLLTHPSAAAKDKDDMDQHARAQPSWSQHLEHLQRLQELYVSSLDFPAVAADSASLVNMSTSTSTSTASALSAVAPLPIILEEQDGREEEARTGLTKQDKWFWLGAVLAVLVIVFVELVYPGDEPQANAKEKTRQRYATVSSSDSPTNGSLSSSVASARQSGRPRAIRRRSIIPILTY